MLDLFEIFAEIQEIIQGMLDSFFAWWEKYFGEKAEDNTETTV